VRMRRKGSPRALLVGMQTGAATLENSMDVPQKIQLLKCCLAPSFQEESMSFER